VPHSSSAGSTAAPGPDAAPWTLIARTAARHTGRVTPNLRLARLQFVAPGGSGPATRATGQLVITDQDTTHVVALDDVLGMLTDLVSNLPHSAPTQVVSASTNGEHVRVKLTSPAGQAVVTFEPNRWYEAVVSLIAQVAEAAERAGCTDLLRPLMAAITGPDLQLSPAP